MKIIISLCVLFLMLSCSNQSNDNRKDGYTEVLKSHQDSLLQEVLNGHDYGMARMGKISKYQTRIQASLDSLNKLPAKKMSTFYKQQLTDLKEKLESATMGMNHWMEEFKMDSFSNLPDERLHYLENEKIKIGDVKNAIRESLFLGDSLLHR